MISGPELVLDARADLAEGPAWDVRSQSLYWVDIRLGRLHTFNPQDGSDCLIEVGESLGCAAPRRSGGLILARRSGLAIINSLMLKDAGKNGVLRSFAAQNTIFSELIYFPGNRFNDGKCDPAGRFLAGSMDNAEQAATGSLYSLAPDGSLKTLLTNLRISNGLAWSPDYATFYFIDTPTRIVMAYDYDLASGEIANPRPVVTVPASLGWPDGMTSDQAGMLWVAMWGGASLTRWDPSTGRLLAHIPLPALNVTSVCFGGPHLTELYLTSARKDMTPAQLAQYPLSGGLFRLRTDIEGMPTFEFGS